MNDLIDELINLGFRWNHLQVCPTERLLSDFDHQYLSFADGIIVFWPVSLTWINNGIKLYPQEVIKYFQSVNNEPIVEFLVFNMNCLF